MNLILLQNNQENESVLLLVKSIFTIVLIHKTEKLDYKIHYLSRIIGESSQKLREIGWL